jgi:hypothetical protein
MERRQDYCHCDRPEMALGPAAGAPGSALGDGMVCYATGLTLPASQMQVSAQATEIRPTSQ